MIAGALLLAALVSPGAITLAFQFYTNAGLPAVGGASQ